MPRFFNHRSNFQVVGDAAVAGINGFKNGAAGKVLLTVTGMGIAAPITAVATACAIGAALTIIPAMYLYEEFFKVPRHAPFLAKMGADILFKSALAFASGCLGAAILGLAIAPIGLAALSASLTFGLLDVMTHLIVDCTAPSNATDENKYMPLALT